MKEKNAIIQHKVGTLFCSCAPVLIAVALPSQDDEIAELKTKMDDMAEEFGEMLRVRYLHTLSIGSNNLFLFCLFFTS